MSRLSLTLATQGRLSPEGRKSLTLATVGRLFIRQLVEEGAGGPDRERYELDLLDEEKWLRSWLRRYDKAEEIPLEELFDAPVEPEQEPVEVEVPPLPPVIPKTRPKELVEAAVASQKAIEALSKELIDKRKAEQKAVQEAQEFDEAVSIMMIVASDDD